MIRRNKLTIDGQTYIVRYNDDWPGEQAFKMNEVMHRVRHHTVRFEYAEESPDEITWEQLLKLIIEKETQHESERGQRGASDVPDGTDAGLHS
jgi:hypothetical protein